MQGISVVIPNFNGLSLFPHTLPTVVAALQALTVPSEVIVADDASTDASLHYLSTCFPDIRVVTNERNSGFSVTVNKGVRAARFPLVLLLNSDVKLTEDYFAHLLPYFEKEDTFGVMGRIVGWTDDKIQDGAKYPSFHGVKIKTAGNYLLEDEAAMQSGLLSMYLSGANALVRKDVYQKCGGLDEIFSPFYVEDYELSLRAWRMGYTCYYEHRAICRHKTSTTIRTSARKKGVEVVYNRNKMYLHAIHLSTPRRYLYFCQLVAEALARFFTGRWSYFRSLSLFLFSYSKVRRSRGELRERAKGNPLKSVRQVADIVLASIKNKRIIRF